MTLDTLAPADATTCRICFAERAYIRYCERTCIRGIQGSGYDSFVDATLVGSAPQPHLHRTCKRCAYEWLTEVTP
jgi:hypothetical protein